MLLFLLLLFFRADTAPPQLLLRQGLQELQQGRLNDARITLEQGSQQAPGNPYFWSGLAEVYWRLGEKQLAATAADKAHQLAPVDPLVCHGLAIYYSEAGDFAQAAKLEEVFASSPSRDKAATARAAQFFLRAKDAASALPLIKQAVSQDSTSAFDWAQLLLRQQAFTQAAQLLEDSLREQPNDVQLTLALGVARYGQRRFEDAVVLFLKAVQLDPSLPQPYEFLGRMLDQADGHLAEIVRDDAAWAVKNPDNGAAQLQLAKALLISHTDDARAEQLLRRAVVLAPNSWEPHYELGVLLSDQHHYEEASQQLQLATECDPSQAMPHYHLARVYDRLGKREEAAAERKLHAQLVNGSDSPH